MKSSGIRVLCDHYSKSLSREHPSADQPFIRVKLETDSSHKAFQKAREQFQMLTFSYSQNLSSGLFIVYSSKSS